MFQPYVVIIRLLAHKKENRFIVVCWCEISVLYGNICVKYMVINLVSIGKEDGQIFKGFILAFQYLFGICCYEGKTNQNGLKLNGTHQLLVYGDDGDILGVVLHTMHTGCQ
jgi:hypothetical protein